jgi:putative transposase
MESSSPRHHELSTATATQRAQALAHFRLLRPFLEDEVPLPQIAALHRLSLRTLRRWVRQYRAHGLAGLMRAGRKDRGHRRSLTPQLRHMIEGLALQKPRRTVANLHRETCRISREHNWAPPSYSTIQRIIRQLAPALTTLAHEGSTAYQEQFDLNGIQLGSKCLLPQGLTQCTTCFCHEGEGFGPPLFDPGLDTIGPYGIDE